MTGETFIRPLEARLPRRLLLQVIKDDALTGIKGRGLEHLAATNPAQRRRVAEIDRAGIAYVDQLALEARLREHQPLRFHRQLERGERAAEISAVCGIEFQGQR